MWRRLRITLLLFLLVVVAVSAWLDQHRTTSWQRTVWVGLFPLNADGSVVSAGHLQQLREADFQPIEHFITDEAQRHGQSVRQPVRLLLFPTPASAPPLLPVNAGWLGSLSWSLKLRWYRWHVVRASTQPAPQIALFLLYHDPSRQSVLPHSLGLQRGLTGLVHLYADTAQEQQNQIVIAHELLHTFGATDKYDLQTLAPLFPDGFADPQRQPRYPQSLAEIMAGRTPLSAGEQQMPDSLAQVLVGAPTAREIGWLR